MKSGKLKNPGNSEKTLSLPKVQIVPIGTQFLVCIGQNCYHQSFIIL